MTDYLALADAALAEFEAERRYEINEINELNTPAPAPTPTQHIVLLAVPDGVPADWFEGIRKVMTGRCPAAFLPDEWAQIRTDCWAVLRDHGAAAVRLGWGPLDLFGVHPKAPLVRHDCMGLALVLRCRPVLDLDETAARIGGGNVLTFTRRARPPVEVVAVWDLIE